MAVDSFSSSPAEVLNDLDPLARALLDLSLKRGMSDDEIGEILGTDGEAVLENRIALMRSLAERVAPEAADADQPELESVLADRLYAEEAAGPAVEEAEAESAEADAEEPGPEAEEAEPEAEEAEPEAEEPEAEESAVDEGVEADPDVADAEETAVEGFEEDPDVAEVQSEEPVATVEPEAEPEPEPEPVEPEPEPEPVATAEPERDAEGTRRRSPLMVIVPLLILAVLVVGLIALIAGGDDDEDAGSPGQQAEQQQPGAGDGSGAAASDAEPRRVRLAALGAGGARGTAVITEDGVRLRIRGLPRGRYEVWLYDNVIDARRIGRVAPDGTVRVKLPDNARDYRYLDFSREPDDGNPNHSGESVLRVPVEKLSG